MYQYILPSKKYIYILSSKKYVQRLCSVYTILFVPLNICTTVAMHRSSAEGWWGPQGQNRLFTWQLTVHGWKI